MVDPLTAFVVQVIDASSCLSKRMLKDLRIQDTKKIYKLNVLTYYHRKKEKDTLGNNLLEHRKPPEMPKALSNPPS